MAIEAPFRRRDLLTATAILTVTSAPRADVAKRRDGASTAQISPYDFSKPTDHVDAFVRVRGDAAGRHVYTYTTGRVYAVQPGAPAVPLLGYQSGLVDQYIATSGGSYLQTRREFMHFTDLVSGELADRIVNPITQTINRPIHGLVGPLLFALTPQGIAFNTHDTREAPGLPFLLNWEQQGPDMTVRIETLRRYRNPIQPAQLRRASTGEYRTYSDFLTYRFSRHDLFDRAQRQIPAQIFYSGQTDLLPWMFMGSTPGHLLWHATGFKTLDREQLPQRFTAITESLHPGLLAEPFTYAERAGTLESQLLERLAEQRPRGP